MPYCGPMVKKSDDRQHREQTEIGKLNRAQPHEADVGVVRDEAEFAHMLFTGPASSEGDLVGRAQANQVATISRVKVKAVKIVVTIPMA